MAVAVAGAISDGGRELLMAGYKLIRRAMASADEDEEEEPRI